MTEEEYIINEDKRKDRPRVVGIVVKRSRPPGTDELEKILDSAPDREILEMMLAIGEERKKELSSKATETTLAAYEKFKESDHSMGEIFTMYKLRRKDIEAFIDLYASEMATVSLIEYFIKKHRPDE